GLFDELDGVTVEIRAHADAQAAGLASARQLTQTKTEAHDAIVDILSAMSRTSQTIPGQEENFRFDTRLKEQALLIAARTAAVKALPIKAEFTKRALRIDFIEVLQSSANTIEQSHSDRVEQTHVHVNATATISSMIEAGMKIVRELDIIMRNLFADDPGMLAAWISASRVERPTRRRRNKPAPEPPPAPTE
ncbi:MAG TPA: hypothetical protein VNZ44_06785, partial [Pyrinomonadaceae bacterium]|nr:hypothetical protein [Pyrinomonadaceae bacterium]